MVRAEAIPITTESFCQLLCQYAWVMPFMCSGGGSPENETMHTLACYFSHIHTQSCRLYHKMSIWKIKSAAIEGWWYELTFNLYFKWNPFRASQIMHTSSTSATKKRNVLHLPCSSQFRKKQCETQWTLHTLLLSTFDPLIANALKNALVKQRLTGCYIDRLVDCERKLVSQFSEL